MRQRASHHGVTNRLIHKIRGKKQLDLILTNILTVRESMKYRVLGNTHLGRRFDVEVFAACAREAEVFVSLRAQCRGEKLTVAGVLDVDRQVILCKDEVAPQLQGFRDMLVELHDVIRIGKISYSASKEYQWLCSVLHDAEVESDFFKNCERRLDRSSTFSSAKDELLTEYLIRLAAIGVSLLESKSVPNTQNLFDLMWQVRGTAILYGPILSSAFNRPQLSLVRSSSR